MKLHASGILRHHFFGDYSAGLGLRFADAESARLALPRLAPPDLGVQWRQSTEQPHMTIICVDSDQLARLKEHLGTLGADVHAIDSVNHSIDHGDPFEITVEVEDPRQLMLV
jgi:hypothetical protein